MSKNEKVSVVIHNHNTIKQSSSDTEYNPGAISLLCMGVMVFTIANGLIGGCATVIFN